MSPGQRAQFLARIEKVAADRAAAQVLGISESNTTSAAKPVTNAPSSAARVAKHKAANADQVREKNRKVKQTSRAAKKVAK